MNLSGAGTDSWSHAVAGDESSVAAWDQAWEQLLHFRGDPIAELTDANRDDDSFIMGPVFSAVYSVLGGSRFDAPALLTHVDQARSRTASAPEREAGHLEALDHLLAGEFTRAAQRWDEVARHGIDFAAIRFAHDVYLHIGDANGRLASSQAATAAWGGRPGANFIAGQYAFALEEVGEYTDAERIGRGALEADPDDLWARHALAHVFESTEDNDATFELLDRSVDRWGSQDLLAAHIWWHLALRLLAVGDISRVLSIFDERLPTATTAFRLCDQSSLLWRAELAGYDVGDRWEGLADRWDGVAERHVCAFLDLHAGLTFARCPDHLGAERWFDGLAGRASGTSQNDRTFDTVVVPLVGAIRAHAKGDPSQLGRFVDELGTATDLIGGSIAQRDLIRLTVQTGDTP